MDFLALAVLVETASAGSLAAAARRLRIAPMAASRALAGLEQELGVRLVHRTTRALALTDDGQVFLPHAQALLEEKDAALASVRPSSHGASGLLRLSCSAAFGRKIANPVLLDFMAANPQVRVDLMVVDTVIDMVAEGIDLAIRIATLPDSTLVARRLADNPCLLVASPAYLERHGRPRTLADLGRHQCLTTPTRSHWIFETEGRKARVKADGRYTASSIEAIHQACIGGLGIADLSAWNVREEIARGLLEPITLADAEPEPLAIWAVYPTRRLVPPKVRLFIEALSTALKA
ncbi:LysR family transcriptional regulator [Azorhizobium doebereinerae]|uniref:LysR family transcriptional regulator n=1 Tax=Azorhizobium doebereinerae TaxID=281091 RepID=UPI00041C2000|nr:LysR family transcriptional regulator [Azorhizobium doebereinerae]